MDLSNNSVKVAISALNDPNPNTWNVFNFRIGNCPDQPFITLSSDKVALNGIRYVYESMHTANDFSLARKIY